MRPWWPRETGDDIVRTPTRACSGATMKTRIVRVGDSQGIRIPKPILAQAGLTDEVELRVTAEGLAIGAVDTGRVGWEEAPY
jgi:antitoxin MazE